MQLRLNLKHTLLQKYDVLDCQNTKLFLDTPEVRLVQNNNAVLKKSYGAYHKTLALEFLSAQKVLHSTALKSYELNNKVVVTVRKNSYFLLLDYFINTILLSNNCDNLIKVQDNSILKNYLVATENVVSFAFIAIKRGV